MIAFFFDIWFGNERIFTLFGLEMNVKLAKYALEMLKYS